MRLLCSRATLGMRFGLHFGNPRVRLCDSDYTLVIREDVVLVLKEKGETTQNEPRLELGKKKKKKMKI